MILLIIVGELDVFNPIEIPPPPYPFPFVMVKFDKSADKWVTTHSFYGDFNPIHIPTGIYLSKEHINVFFKGFVKTLLLNPQIADKLLTVISNWLFEIS